MEEPKVLPVLPVGRRSGNFRGLKLTLMVLQILGILCSLLLIESAAEALWPVDTRTSVERDHQLRRNPVKLLAAGIIGLLINAIGLFGALKENWILTFLFGVIILSASILSIDGGIDWPFEIGVIVAVLSFVYVYLIQKEVIGNSA